MIYNSIYYIYNIYMDKVDIFQKEIYKRYKKYKINKKLTFKQICFPSSFTFQLPQLFVSDFINPFTKYNGLLLYHKIGAGKTCAAVRIAENFKGKRNIIMLCPASLVGNFYKEIRSECTGNNYISKSDRENLNKLNIQSSEYKQIIKSINDKINKHYQIYSYNKIIELISNRKIKFSNSLLIIDEVQNIVSEHGTFYKTIYNAIKKAKNIKIVIMSATPIFDKPMELGLTLNLLLPKEDFEVGNKFNDKYIDYRIINNLPQYDIKNENQLRLRLNGLVSYFGGAPSYVFPERKQKIIKCPMSKYQYDCYKTVQDKEGKINKLDLLKLPNNFFIGSRIISNIAFPNKLVNKAGLNALTKRAMDMDNLQTYSTKYYEIMKRVFKSNGTIFIYSNFREYGGLISLIKILEYYGFKNFLTNGVGKNRYAIWSGEETQEQKEKFKEIFNSKDNYNGSKIKIILGSPAIKEGVTLLRVRHVHIIEPYWNMSRLEQVIGRAIRFCSHKDVDKEKRIVKVYIYIATIPIELALKEKEYDKEATITVDEHIYNMATTKEKLSYKFEQVIKNSAIDYKLFQ
jgi:superfamily II DNA or RNA helicase